MEPWGIEGANHHAFGMFVDVEWYRDPKVEQAMAKVPMAIVSYYPVPHIVKGMLRTRNELQSEVNFKDLAPESQFGDGWYRGEVTSDMRWASPRAEVTLYRPAGSKEFEISCSVPAGSSKVTVLEDGHALGVQTLSDPNGQALRWKLPVGGAGDKRIAILSEPVRYLPDDLHRYGLAMKSLRYVE